MKKEHFISCTDIDEQIAIVTGWTLQDAGYYITLHLSCGDSIRQISDGS